MAFETLVMQLRALLGNWKGLVIAILAVGWAISRFAIGGVLGELVALGLLLVALMLLVSLLRNRRKEQ